MCGRYVMTKTEKRIARRLGLHGDAAESFFSDRYNVSPSQSVPAIRVSDGHMALLNLRWGLVPFWAKGIAKIAPINATVEKLESGQVWRLPWKQQQRCLMPAWAFYEWHLNEESGATEPHCIRPTDQEDFCFAAVWDRSEKTDGEVIESCAMVTMPANELMATVHNSKLIGRKRQLLPPGDRRMPAILHERDWETWLMGSADQAKALLTQYPASAMTAWRVSAAVSAPKNQGPELIEPVADASA